MSLGGRGRRDQVERDRGLQGADEQVERGGALAVDLAQQQQAVDEQHRAHEHQSYSGHRPSPGSG